MNKRLSEHKKGSVSATKYRRPLVLIYSEKHDSKAKAFNCERLLKSLWGAREKKKILKKFLGDLG